MELTFRPLPDWPYPPTKPHRDAKFKVRRKGADGYTRQVRTPWDQTLRDLEYEIVQLIGKNVLFGVGLSARDIRLDGKPRADARQFNHPGVEISFDSRFGRLTYATDEFNDWQDNVRAIALSLEALRAVDRYGVSKRGQQYAGWAQLAAGGPDPERGRVLVERAESMAKAMFQYHPDHGGDERDMVDVLAFRDQLRARTAS